MHDFWVVINCGELANPMYVSKLARLEIYMYFYTKHKHTSSNMTV